MSDKIETVQYNTALAITGAIRGISKEKLYQELGLESLKDRRWLRRMSLLYKTILTKLPPYLHELIFTAIQNSQRYPGCFQTSHCRITLFQNSFLPFIITKWNEFDSVINNIDSHAMFRKKLFTFIRPLENDTYGIYVLDHLIDCVWISTI